jgi:hypothetical protein
MRIRVFDLCDSATERDGLLTVVNGGINIFNRPEFPAPLLCDLALSFELDVPDSELEFSGELRIRAEDSREEVAHPMSLSGTISEIIDGAAPLLNSMVVARSVDLSRLQVPSPGRYRIELYDGDALVSYLRFAVNDTRGGSNELTPAAQ